MNDAGRPPNERVIHYPIGSLIGWTPEGRWIANHADLPVLSIPERVVVATDHIDIDGWLFPYSLINRAWLKWLQQSFLRWFQSATDDRGRQWIEGIIHAFEDRLTGEY